MIPSPNLDDRTYQDIMSEAKRLIPRYCPEWTNYNPTDPGMTLLELFAWMTEMTIYRINKVPEKTYLALLDMMGLSPTPPQAARAILQFAPVEGYSKPIRVRKGLQVSVGGSGDGQPIIFETEKDLTVNPNSLAACIATSGGRISDYGSLLSPSKGGFPLFGGQDLIERYIYIHESALGFLAEQNVVSITFATSRKLSSVNEELTNFLAWEYWNGQKWLPVAVRGAAPGEKRQDNQVFVEGPLDIAPFTLEGREGWFLRASLTELPGSLRAFDVERVLVKLIFKGEGLNPDLCLCNTGNMVFQELDINKDFSPFAEIPKYNDIFYIASDEILAKEDARVILSFALAEGDAAAEPNEDLVLKYEFFNGREWASLGESHAGRKAFDAGRWRFSDATEALTQSGEVSFDRPSSMRKASVNGQEAWWIRVRIAAGNFGTGGQYVQDEHGGWSWAFEKAVKAPQLNRVRLRYDARKKAAEGVWAYYDFGLKNLGPAFAANEALVAKGDLPESVSVFVIRSETVPVTYFGFERPFADGDFSLYFRLLDHGARVRAGWVTDSGPRSRRARRALALSWEYWNGASWQTLDAEDSTDSFHESGFISFHAPADMASRPEFGKNLYWLRLAFNSGSFESAPQISRVLLNCVTALNCRTWFDEVLGASNAGLLQEFKLLREPVLPGMELMIREDALPPSRERDLIIGEEGEGAIQSADGSDSGEIWIRWHEVESFNMSSPISRHYTIDYGKGVIHFSDGVRGMVPPRIKANIKARCYRVGGGTQGNVAPGTISVMRDNVAFIAGVHNPFAAEGGADLEDMESLKSRAAGIFKSMDRAVTREDYEWLALESSSSVARARCLPRCGTKGEVVVIVVPTASTVAGDSADKPIPSPELLRRVREYLDERRLIGTLLRVEGPVYRPIALRVRLAIKKTCSDVQALKDEAELRIRRALHPISGGEGKGWPFGVPLTPAAVFDALEGLTGLHHVEEVSLVDTVLGKDVEKVPLGDDELVHLTSVSLDARKFEW